MSGTAALFRKIRDGAFGAICPKDIQYVLPIDSSALLKFRPVATIHSGTVDAAEPLRKTSNLVQSGILVGGPRADGIVTNSQIIFIGGPEVAKGNGYPLLPGAQLGFDAIDLNELFFAVQSADDRLRVLVFA